MDCLTFQCENPENRKIPSKTLFKKGFVGFFKHLITQIFERSKTSNIVKDQIEQSFSLFLTTFIIFPFLSIKDVKFRDFCNSFIQKATEADKTIEVPGDSGLNFYVKGTDQSDQNQEKPFELKIPLFGESTQQNEQPSEPFKINLSLGFDENESSNDPPMQFKIPLLPENSAKGDIDTNTLTDPKNPPLKGPTNPLLPALFRKSSPEKKIGGDMMGSLNKSQSEKSLAPKIEIKLGNTVSPKSQLRRANSAVNKPTSKKSSQDDSSLNYNKNPLDYIFSHPGGLKKTESDKADKTTKEFEDIPSPGEVKKQKLPDILSPSSLPRRLSNSLAVSISPTNKERAELQFSLRNQLLNESMDSGLKKYKVVRIVKSLTGSLGFDLFNGCLNNKKKGKEESKIDFGTKTRKCESTGLIFLNI